MISENFLYILVFVISSSLGMNIIETLTATTIYQSDLSSHSSIAKRLDKTVIFFSIKNAMHLIVLFVIFLMSMFVYPDIMDDIFLIFTIMMIITIVAYAIINPYYIESVRPVKTRLGRKFRFKINTKKEKRILWILKNIRIINATLMVVLLGILIIEVI